MNNFTPYQKKFFLLSGSILILLILSYLLSVKKAAIEIDKYRSLQQKNASISGLGTALHKWSTLNASLDWQLGSNPINSGFQENLLHETGQFCSAHDLKLKEFSEPFEGEDGDYLVETIILNIEGDFKPLLQLVHHLEQNFKGGKISSTSFYREKNFRTNREELFLKLYVQKIKKSEEQG